MSYRTALYTRISADHAKDGGGVDSQRRSALALAEREGLTVVATFSDNDISASENSRKNRPQFEAMIEAARRGEFTHVLAYSMSRLSRRPREWQELIELGQVAGVQFVYVVSPRYDLNTADGRATARTVIAWDIAEAERISERRKERNRDRAGQGIPAGRPRVFGYEPNGMTPREDEAELIRAAYADVLAGVPVRQIARGWNAAGWRTLRGSAWSAVTARNCLTRERNAGILIANGERAAASKITPIVSLEVWEAACAILGAGASRKPSGRPTGERWLSGVATCACGEPLRVGASWSRGVYSPAYVCALIAQASRTPGRPTPSGHARIKAELLESTALPELRAAMGAGVVESDATPELARLVREEADIAAQLTRAKELYSTFGGADDLARARGLQAELTRVQETIEAARNAGSAPLSEAARTLYRVLEAWRADPLEWGELHAGAEALATWEATWPTLDIEERRGLVRRHLSVTVNRPNTPERVTVAAL